MTKEEAIQRQIDKKKKQEYKFFKHETNKQDLKISEMHSNNPFFNNMFINAYRNNGGFNA